MDKPVLIIEAPILEDDAAASVYHFLQEFVLAFELHYYPQLVRGVSHHQSPDLTNEQIDVETFKDDEIPF